MININNLLPVVKELIYSTYSDETEDISKLKARVKFDTVVMDVLADALEAKADKDNKGYNPYLVCNLFRWYSVFVKSYGLLLETNKLVEVSKDEKATILQLIGELTDLDEANTVIEKLNSLTALNQEPAMETVGAIAAEIKKPVKDKKTPMKTAKHTIIAAKTAEPAKQ